MTKNLPEGSMNPREFQNDQFNTIEKAKEIIGYLKNFAFPTEQLSWFEQEQPKPSFFVSGTLKRESDMKTPNPVIANKIWTNIIGTEPKSTRFNFDKQVFTIELSKNRHMDLICGEEYIILNKVKYLIDVKPYEEKNKMKGFISHRLLKDISEVEILDELKHQSVEKVEAINRRVETGGDGEEIVFSKFGSFAITFATNLLKSEVKIGYLKINVRKYYDNPRKCKKCYLIGHTTKRCENKPTCVKCGSTDHVDSNNCNEQMKCVNCLEETHDSNDRNCPIFLFEKRMIAYATDTHVSQNKARMFALNAIQKIQRSMTQGRRSYAEIAKEHNLPILSDYERNNRERATNQRPQTEERPRKQTTNYIEAIQQEAAYRPRFRRPLNANERIANAPKSDYTEILTSLSSLHKSTRDHSDSDSSLSGRRAKKADNKDTPPSSLQYIKQ